MRIARLIFCFALCGIALIMGGGCLCWLTGNCEEPLTAPSGPSPSNGSSELATSLTLSWQNGESGTGKSVTYDVYFGVTNPPPLRYRGLTSRVQEVDSLTLAKTYYWKVVVNEQGGKSLTGQIWSFTTVFPPKYLGVTYPNWAVNWPRGEMRTIQWASAYAGTQVRLELWKAGLNLCTIAAAASNVGSFDWTLTDCGDRTDADYRIKVTSLSDEALYDHSDFFTVTIPCPIELFSPRLRDSWIANENHPIQWRPLGLGSGIKVSLHLYKGPQFQYIIAGVTADDGLHDWIVSDFNGGSGIDYRIRVTDLNEFDCSRFSEFFEIQACSVRFESPASGELWPLETQQIITWDPTFLPETVTLELYHDGDFVCVLDHGAVNTGSYPWTVTRCESSFGENFQIKVHGGETGSCGFSGRYRLH